MLTRPKIVVYFPSFRKTVSRMAIINPLSKMRSSGLRYCNTPVATVTNTQNNKTVDGLSLYIPVNYVRLLNPAKVAHYTELAINAVTALNSIVYFLIIFMRHPVAVKGTPDIRHPLLNDLHPL